MPVWFATEGNWRELFLLPMHGSKSQWYRNLVKGQTIRISLGKNSATVKPKSITSKNIVEDIANRFRKKYGDDQVKKYYTRFDACVELPLD